MRPPKCWFFCRN